MRQAQFSCVRSLQASAFEASLGVVSAAVVLTGSMIAVMVQPFHVQLPQLAIVVLDGALCLDLTQIVFHAS